VDTTDCNNKNRYNEHERHGAAFRFKGWGKDQPEGKSKTTKETLISLFYLCGVHPVA
jgi:hypothetical protein